MKRNAVVSLLLSIALVCGGDLFSQPAVADESNVEITPFVVISEQYPTETGATSLDRAAVEGEEEETSTVQRLPIDPADIERAKKTGTIYVVNKSSYGAYVYLDRAKVNSTCLRGGYTLKISNVKRGQHELIAPDCDNPDYGWGPTTFKLKKEYYWTLTD